MTQKKEMGSSTQTIEYGLNERMTDRITTLLICLKSFTTDTQQIEVEVEDDFIDVIVDEAFHHKIYFRENACRDVVYGEGEYPFRVVDLRFSVEIFEHRDRVIEIYKEEIGE